ncbi:FecR family protein [Aquimarina sp. RZ0]|uniref:FecR family protein n=1 Tax=Aquimarina sp. RZ0 TaxID=2607730 RepID=UPI00165ED278|nr:FecR domain-containing protein [Aquimarina sp. RZ0]
MGKQPIDDDLLIRYLEKDATEQETIFIEDWISFSDQNKTYFRELTNLWSASNSQKDLNDIDIEKDWKKVQTRINTLKLKKKTRKLTPAILWKIAAGFALLIAISLYQYTENQKITLLAIDAPEKFELPDGSLVWLNKGSELSYKKEFSRNSRDLLLKGEGYFEVKKNPHKPFTIQLNNTKTSVLGTQFNLKENTDTSVALVLVEGSVAFSTEQEQLIVAPGEKISSNLSGNLLKVKNPDANFMAWKTRVLKFDETPMTKVIQDISQLYQITFSIEDKELLSCHLTMQFDQASLQNVLETLQILYEIEYQLESENTYRIKGGKC